MTTSPVQHRLAQELEDLHNELRICEKLYATQLASLDLRKIRARIDALALEVRNSTPGNQSEYRILKRTCKRLELCDDTQNQVLTVTESRVDDLEQRNPPGVPAPKEWSDSEKCHAVTAKQFPGLKNLELNCDPLKSTLSFSTLEHWLEGVENLSIHSWDPKAADNRELPTRQFALRSLELSNCVFDRKVFFAFLNKFPRLESLTLSSGYQEASDSPSDLLLSYLVEHCPHLKHLTLGILEVAFEGRENALTQKFLSQKQLSLKDIGQLFPKITAAALAKFQKQCGDKLQLVIQLERTMAGQKPLEQSYAAWSVEGFAISQKI